MVTNLTNFLSKGFQNVKNLNEREHKDRFSREREDYSRDYSRVIYSNSVRRQQGKMQLFAVNGTTNA